MGKRPHCSQWLALETNNINIEFHFIHICIVWIHCNYKQHSRLNYLKIFLLQTFYNAVLQIANGPFKTGLSLQKRKCNAQVLRMKGVLTTWAALPDAIAALGRQEVKLLAHSLQRYEWAPHISQAAKAEPTQEENKEMLLCLPRLEIESIPENLQFRIYSSRNCSIFSKIGNK